MKTSQVIAAIMVFSVTIVGVNAQTAKPNAPTTTKESAGDQSSVKAAIAAVQAQEKAAAAARQRLMAIRAALKAKMAATP